MKHVFRKIGKDYFTFFLGSLVLTTVVVLSCQKQENSFSSHSQQRLSSTQSKTSMITTTASSMSQQEALKVINGLFADELYPISLEQVQGIDKQQFTQWLRSSKIAAAEQEYFGPLLSSNVSEFVLLRNVTFRQTGKVATIALVAVPRELHVQYSKLIVAIDYKDNLIGRLCRWNACDYSSDMCLCLFRTQIVPLNSSCSTDQCDPHNGSSCERAGQQCNNLNVLETISAF